MKTTGITDMRAAVLSWALKLSEEDAVNALKLVDSVSADATWMSAAESPLERLFLATMSVHPGFSRLADDMVLFCGYYLDIQLDVSGFRVDIALLNGDSVYVELDGHDFHERTKEHAARDRKRDRALAGPSCSVLRFTGSEVYADPVGCVSELAVKLIQLSEARESTLAWHKTMVEEAVAKALDKANRSSGSTP